MQIFQILLKKLLHEKIFWTHLRLNLDSTTHQLCGFRTLLKLSEPQYPY